MVPRTRLHFCCDLMIVAKEEAGSFCYTVSVIKITTVIFTITIAVLAVMHYLSLQFHLYWLYPWFDLLMHAWGGAAVALGWFTLRDFLPRLRVEWLSLVPTLSFVFFIALLWEVFEAVSGISQNNPDFLSDTIGDLVFGLGGGFIGYLMAKRLHDNL